MEELQWYRTFPDFRYEGVIASYARNRGSFICYISSSSVTLLGDEEDEKEEKLTEANNDEPEETIDLDGLEINRQDFYEFIEGDSTCHVCGLDLEFKSGHVMDNAGNFICVDCKELDIVKQFTKKA